MKKDKLLKYITALLTLIVIVSLSILNLYVSIYYDSPSPETAYTIKPLYFLGLIGVLIITQYICVYKLHNKKN